MSDENDKLFTIELTEDEIDQCTHAINELCEVFVKDGHSLKELEIQSYLNTARKLESLVSFGHAGEDESFSMSKNAKQAFDHALATRGNIVGDTLSVIISEAVENKDSSS